MLVVDPCSAFTRPLRVHGHPSSHGFFNDGLGYQLEMPANTQTVVVVPAAGAAIDLPRAMRWPRRWCSPTDAVVRRVTLRRR